MKLYVKIQDVIGKCAKPVCPKPKCELVCENPNCKPKVACCACDGSGLG